MVLRVSDISWTLVTLGRPRGVLLALFGVGLTVNHQLWS